MKAIQEFENYATYSINDLGNKQFYWFIRQALCECNVTTISVNGLIGCDEPIYKTQIPYSSGFIQDRFVYQNVVKIASYILFALSQPDAFEKFLCEYTCWDLYIGHELVLSLNVVQGIITVNTNYISLPKENEGVSTHENE